MGGIEMTPEQIIEALITVLLNYAPVDVLKQALTDAAIKRDHEIADAAEEAVI